VRLRREGAARMATTSMKNGQFALVS
jgi:hypothetical protein